MSKKRAWGAKKKKRQPRNGVQRRERAFPEGRRENLIHAEKRKNNRSSAVNHKMDAEAHGCCERATSEKKKRSVCGRKIRTSESGMDSFKNWGGGGASERRYLLRESKKLCQATGCQETSCRGRTGSRSEKPKGAPRGQLKGHPPSRRRRFRTGGGIQNLLKSRRCWGGKSDLRTRTL